MMDRKQIEKILAVALNPGAYDEEAVAAIRRAREIVKKNPKLAYPESPPAPASPPPPTPPKPEHSIEYRVSKIAPFWIAIFMGNISEEAYGLGLRSKLSCDFSEEPLVAVTVRCDGPKEACDRFVEHLEWIIEHINSKPQSG